MLNWEMKEDTILQKDTDAQRPNYLHKVTEHSQELIDNLMAPETLAESALKVTKQETRVDTYKKIWPSGEIQMVHCMMYFESIGFIVVPNWLQKNMLRK